MRQAGTIPNQRDAQRLIDHLRTLGIEAKTEPSGDDVALWIYDENQLEQSKSELAEFRENPADPRYAAAARTAEALRREAEAARRKASKNIVDVRERWQLPVTGPTPVTKALMLICVGVAIVSKLGTDLTPIDPYLFITKINASDSSLPLYQPGLKEIRDGQLWRLVTPSFIHFGMLHIAFNLLITLGLGSQIESRRGSLRFLLLVLLSAALSNLGQYAYSGPAFFFVGHQVNGGPMFGGMSGVNYALFGYAWIRPRVTGELLYLDSRSVFLFLLWFFVAFTGSCGPIANVAHAVGLIVGISVAASPMITRRF